MTARPNEHEPSWHDGDAALAERLAARLRELWEAPARIEGLRLLPGGASRETWSFDAHLPGRPAAGLILRRDPPDSTRPAHMAREAAAFTAAVRAGVPEPRLYDHGDGEGGPDVPYLLMERLEGETIPRRLLRDDRWERARDGLVRELGRTLARIHTIPTDAVPDLPGGDPLDRLTATYADLGEQRPAVEIGLRWLERNRPRAAGECVVHGDFRNGNLLVGPDGLRGVLDWELVHRGDPIEDLGWLCVKAWRFGSPAPAGGFGSRQELLDGYAEVSGAHPDAATLHWWEVYGTLRWALLCRAQAERHLSGTEPSIELAVLGRRVCEQEHDLLLALGLTQPRDATDPLDEGADQRAACLHDLPDLAGLLEAVREFLTGEGPAGADDRARFHARVAANAVTIIRRELLVGPGQQERHHQRLAGLGCTDDAEFARAIRAGTLDHRWDDVVGAVRDTVTDRLLVANPSYLAQPG